jgi:trehalose synthase
VREADVHVFSRPDHVWDGFPADSAAIVPPCIDVLSPKNQPLDRASVRAILEASGLECGIGSRSRVAKFVRRDGSCGAVTNPATVIGEAPLPVGAPLVVQVSRWDRLKDPIGVIDGFVRGRASMPEGTHLVLAGPSTTSVDDDPEGLQVFADVRDARADLPEGARRTIHLACTSGDDADENSAIVNALQQRADVVVQKSLAEGFGLTVAEAMWKSRPVVASRVGGIQDQIVNGESGVLVDPTDHHTFATVVAGLLRNKERSRRMGVAARRRVSDNYLPSHHFAHEAELLEMVGRF